MIQNKELISFITHVIAAAAAVVGIIVLAFVATGNARLQFVSVVYGGSVCWLFVASSVYHARKRDENDQSVWRKLDHIAIFFMIAGTYTATCYAYLPPVWFYVIVSAQWAIVVFGIFFKFFCLNAPRVVYTLIYLAMGWMAVIPIHHLYTAMPGSQFALLLLGGVSFSLGAVFYAIKRPVIIPGWFGFHEIFHVMIMIGGALHYIFVYRAFALMNSLAR